MWLVEIYTDGACSGNPGPGGYAGLLFCPKLKKKETISGGEKNTTNNRMELMAVIKSLEYLKQPCEVNLYTDSAYVFNALDKKWIYNWQLNNWKTSEKKDVLNQDLWINLLDLLSIHKVHFFKVKGHSTDEKNNECDRIAREEIKKITSIN